MKIIQDLELLERVFETQKTHFQSRPPLLRLLEFEKGELLNHPLKPLDQFLLIIKGSITIYDISHDGRIRYITRGGHGELLGDMEFSGSKGQAFYTETTDPVLCLSIPFQENRSILENDPVFLRFVLYQLAEKLSLSSTMDAQTLEEKVLLYLKTIQPSHEIHSVNQAMQLLHCSRRQLQRVLRKLCDEEVLVKTKRGNYQLKESPSRSYHDKQDFPFEGALDTTDSTGMPQKPLE